MNLLLQATQPTGGMATWNAAEWTVFFTAATALVGALTAGIVAIVKAMRTDVRMEAVEKRQDRQSERVDKVLRDMPPPKE